MHRTHTYMQVADVDAKTVMDLMIVTQYFDTMKDSASPPARACPPTRPPARLPACAVASHTWTCARCAVGAKSKTNAVFLNHSPGALGDLTQSVQKGFMAAAPAAGSMSR